jgi:hypothetical protein
MSYQSPQSGAENRAAFPDPDDSSRSPFVASDQIFGANGLIDYEPFWLMVPEAIHPTHGVVMTDISSMTMALEFAENGWVVGMCHALLC